MQAKDVEEATRIMRLAFGTFIGLPDPENFGADRAHVAHRWRAQPDGCLVAEYGQRLAGSSIMTRWGSFAFFGPLTIHPELWNRRIAQKLLAPTIELLDFWGVKQAGLFTFANSVKHIALYQKFGFWPRFLTAILFKPVKSVPFEALVYSHLSADARESALGACRELTDAIFEGLDLTSEISALETEKLGDTVLLGVDDALDAFAICHCGEGTEAGRGNCYLKFAAARDESSFVRLLAACEAFAAERGLENIEAGVNLERSRAYSSLLNAGFRTLMQGVAMMRPDAPGYNRPDVFAIDDWR